MWGLSGCLITQRFPTANMKKCPSFLSVALLKVFQTFLSHRKTDIVPFNDCFRSEKTENEVSLVRLTNLEPRGTSASRKQFQEYFGNGEGREMSQVCLLKSPPTQRMAWMFQPRLQSFLLHLYLSSWAPTLFPVVVEHTIFLYLCKWFIPSITASDQHRQEGLGRI